MHDIFISYSHDDKLTADAICAKLEHEGIRCWYAPRDAEFGDAWAGSIVNAIKSTKAMVLVFTEFSNASSQVRKEVTLAVNAAKTIIPFRATNTMPTDSMEYLLCDLHWLDAYDESTETSLASLLERVKAILPVAEKETVVRANDIEVIKPLTPTKPSGNYDNQLPYRAALNNVRSLCEVLAINNGKDFESESESSKNEIRLQAILLLATAKSLHCDIRPKDSLGKEVVKDGFVFCDAFPIMQKEYDILLEEYGLPKEDDPNLSTKHYDEEIIIGGIIDFAKNNDLSMYYPLSDSEKKIVSAQIKKIIEEAKSRNELWQNLLQYHDIPGIDERYESALDDLETRIELGFI